MNFNEALKDLQSLVVDFRQIRSDLCHNCIIEAKVKCQQWDIKVERHIKKRRKFPGELILTAKDDGLSAEEKIYRVMKSALDRLDSEIDKRFVRLKEVENNFGFLLDLQTLLGTKDT